MRRRQGTSLAACVLLALTLACASAPVALAAGSLNNELAEKAQQQGAETTTAATVRTSSTSESNSSNTKTLVIVASAAGALLAAIAFVIVRDARRVAPVTDTAMGETGTSRRSAAELRRRRAKARAARQQRKRNR